MRILDLGELRKMSVLDAGSGDKVGDVIDAIVHPTEGRLVGALVRLANGEEAVLPVDSLRIGDNAVMAIAGAPFELRTSSSVLRDGVLAGGTLVGANVVTEDGRLLGKVSDVEIMPELGLAAYKVSSTVLQKIFGGGFYIAGDLPRALSSDGVRMIVPSDTEEKHAADAVEALLRKGGSADRRDD
jgi:sporulation protein YlmC with PRC-barrel domain